MWMTSSTRVEFEQNVLNNSLIKNRINLVIILLMKFRFENFDILNEVHRYSLWIWTHELESENWSAPTQLNFQHSSSATVWMLHAKNELVSLSPINWMVQCWYNIILEGYATRWDDFECVGVSSDNFHYIDVCVHIPWKYKIYLTVAPRKHQISL